MKTTKSVSFLAVALCSVFLFSAFADAQRPGRGDRANRGGQKEDGESSAKKDKIKSYDEVITDEAESSAGLFKTHRIDEKLFYEIPIDKLGKDMLWVVQIEKTQAGFSYAGMPVRDRVVRWERRGDQILLRDVKYTIRADSKDESIRQAVSSTSVAPIIRSFPVACWGTDKKPVIDVTSLFTSDISEFSPKQTLNASGIDAKKTFVETVKPYEENINVEVLATYKLSGAAADRGGQGGPPRRGAGARRDSSQSSVTVVLHHSMRELPNKPMQARVFDSRVGFFTVRFQDFANDENHEVENVQLITRWRLEKKDPEAEVSEPVKPIVFYVGREVPEKWKPYVKRGIEMWQPAFEAAGFKNAIVGKLAPNAKDDPDWDPEDSRISTIRWLPSTTENAFGPHVHDPRTGEILEADVRIYHNVLKLCRDWYFCQAAACDERAQQLPMPDDLIGELLAYVVAHEVGHSIGFPHNMKASAAFTVENLRDKDFTEKWGTEASIMDYGRFNYVAQPGDGARLIPKIGPYDFFAIKWGYGQYDDEKAERTGLDELLAMQKENPMLRFGGADPSEDPTRQTEDLGNDPIKATELGLKNIDRIAEILVEACCKEGKDYRLLQNMYDALISQRSRELMHVTSVVGGFERINLYFGDADRVFFPIIAGRQKAAIEFLNEHAFKTNPKLINPEITTRLEADGAADRILGSQRRVLTTLINDSRVKRMAEYVERAKTESQNAEVYSPTEMLADIRGGVWNELVNDEGEIDLFRRNLQRTHVEILAMRLKAVSSDSDLPALCRAELQLLKAMIEELANTDDPETRAHLEQILAQIDAALDPKVGAEETSQPTPTRRR
jgi:hypothetical protein